jgi:hypothetical protein
MHEHGRRQPVETEMRHLAHEYPQQVRVISEAASGCHLAQRETRAAQQMLGLLNPQANNSLIFNSNIPY